MHRLPRLVLAAFLLLPAAPPRADVALPPIFTDRLVLQRGLPAPVRGTADAGEEVTVRILNQARKAVAGADGRWEVRLEALEAGGPHTLTVSGKNTIALNDVLVGEGWLGSGQSNMVQPLSEVSGGGAAAANPRIRLFTVPVAEKPGWTAARRACAPETASKFSAVAYFFGRDLQARLQCPVVNLFNREGLPASPFRTDDAPVQEPSR
jgi:sialate O-acetylesterase